MEYSDEMNCFKTGTAASDIILSENIDDLERPDTNNSYDANEVTLQEESDAVKDHNVAIAEENPYYVQESNTEENNINENETVSTINHSKQAITSKVCSDTAFSSCSFPNENLSITAAVETDKCFQEATMSKEAVSDNFQLKDCTEKDDHDHENCISLQLEQSAQHQSENLSTFVPESAATTDTSSNLGGAFPSSSENSKESNVCFSNGSVKTDTMTIIEKYVVPEDNKTLLEVELLPEQPNGDVFITDKTSTTNNIPKGRDNVSPEFSFMEADSSMPLAPAVNHLTEDITLNSVQNSQIYRTGVTLVAYSDSEDSTCSENSSGAFDEDDNDVNNNNNDSDYDSDTGTPNGTRETEASSYHDKLKGRLRTYDEVFPEELPPLDYLTISVPEETELVSLGTVTGIVDIMVVIKAMEATPALYDDSVLFLENRQSLGMIFETIGTVDRPFYTVRFNSLEDITERGITVGDKVLYAPKADNLTKYIFLSELRKMKCDDASWTDDNEPPEWVREFSDDEEERMASRMNKSLLQKKRLRSGAHGVTGDLNPCLMQGDLKKNPFGDLNQEFGMKSVGHKHKRRRKSKHTDKESNLANQIYPPMPSALATSQSFMNKTKSVASFGGKPAWQNHQVAMGPMLKTQPISSGKDHGIFQSNSTFQGFHSAGNIPTQPFRMPVMPAMNQMVRPILPPPDLSRPPPTITGFGFRNHAGPAFMNSNVIAPPFSPPPVFIPPPGNYNFLSQSRPSLPKDSSLTD